MMKALELFNAGEVTRAIEAATEQVRNHPTDTPARMILAELLCFSGAFERADKQLETAFLQSPDLNIVTALGRQLIRAATARHKCFTEGALPDLLAPSDPIIEHQLRLLAVKRAGANDQADELIDHLQDYCDQLQGTANNTTFAGFRDLDDLSSCCLEVLTSTGKYYWVPWHRIESLTFEPIARPRDLLWREAHINVRQGPDAVVYVPVTYPGTTLEHGEASVLGRETSWEEPEQGPVTGVGQRVFLAGDQELAILELESLSFNDPHEVMP